MNRRNFLKAGGKEFKFYTFIKNLDFIWKRNMVTKTNF